MVLGGPALKPLVLTSTSLVGLNWSFVLNGAREMSVRLPVIVAPAHRSLLGPKSMASTSSSHAMTRVRCCLFPGCAGALARHSTFDASSSARCRGGSARALRRRCSLVARLRSASPCQLVDPSFVIFAPGRDAFHCVPNLFPRVLSR